MQHETAQQRRAESGLLHERQARTREARTTAVLTHAELPSDGTPSGTVMLTHDEIVPAGTRAAAADDGRDDRQGSERRRADFGVTRANKRPRVLSGEAAYSPPGRASAPSP